MKLALIGAGNLGGAIARAAIDTGVCPEGAVTLVEQEPDLRAALEAERGWNVAGAPSVAVFESDLIVFAVKPQDWRPAAATLREGLTQRSTVMSVMAGVRLSLLAEVLGDAGTDAPYLVRAMPNLAVTVGEGMTGYYAPPEVPADRIAAVEELLTCMGSSFRVPEESLLDAVTAVSGSGPAYVCFLIEAITEAGVRCGLSPDDARRGAEATLRGTAALIAAGESAASLRARVTSKGGTTAAAVEVLEQRQAFDIIVDAVVAAFKRASELSA